MVRRNTGALSEMLALSIGTQRSTISCWLTPRQCQLATQASPLALDNNCIHVCAVTLLLILALVGCLATAVPSFAQVATGTIVGIVTDSSGNIVPGAKIQLLNKATNQTASTVSGAQGFYSFPLLKPALYEISARAPGFKEFVQDNIELDVATTLTVNLKLQVGAITQ